MSMDPQLKNEWADRLEDGTYKQGHGCLCTRVSFNDGHPEDKFCCLGVLADIIRNGEEDWDDNTDGYVTLHWQGECGEREHKIAQLPAHMQTRAGITPDQCSDLINMNDGNDEDGIQPHTFAEIAAWIRRNL